jgi:hypothetical protein
MLGNLSRWEGQAKLTEEFESYLHHLRGDVVVQIGQNASWMNRKGLESSGVELLIELDGEEDVSRFY